MKNLRRLGASVALISVLAVAVFAGQTPTMPCAPPAPGELQTPPCATAPLTSDANATGELEPPPAASEGTELTITLAMDLLQSVLSIF